MGYELGWRLIEHPGLRSAVCGFVFDTVNTSTANVFFEFVLFDDITQVGAAADPVSLLDNPSVHVYQVEASVGPGGTVDRAKIGIPGRNKFLSVIGIGHDQFCLFYKSPSPRAKRQSRLPSTD